MTSRSTQVPYEDFFLSNERNQHEHYRSSSQASWSPSWITPASGNNYQREEHLFRERRALHMEQTKNAVLDQFPPNVRTMSFGATARRSPSPSDDDYPFFFSDPADGGSVQTGMSQQELLRKKARESKKQTRYGKTSNTTKRKKPVVQITGFLSSRSPRNTYTPSSNLPYSMSREMTGDSNGLTTTTTTTSTTTRWPRGKQDVTRSEDIELSTAETTLTDSSSRFRTKNPPSPLRVVLDGGDLVLTARQSKLNPEFSKLGGDDEDFPLLSRSASDSFQMDTASHPSEQGAFSGQGYLLDNLPGIAREHILSRQALSIREFPLGEPRITTRSKGMQSNQFVNASASSEWLLRSREKKESFETDDQNRSVRFREDLVRSPSFDSRNETRREQSGDRKPKSILRESRYRTSSHVVLPSSSPSRFFIRKPATPERSDGSFLKSSRSAHSPSDILDETRRVYSSFFYESQSGELSAQSDERYPDPPLDNANIDDDDTTFASRNDAFLETIAAIVIQAAVRRFLAMRYVDMLTEHIANEMHAKYVRLSEKSNEHQMQSRAHTASTPLPASPTNRVLAEIPKPQTSPSLPLAPPHRTNRDRGFEEKLQQKMVNDMYTLAAIRIQAVFRGFWARDSLDVDHFCATLIQRCVRRHLYEKKYRHGHYHLFRYVVRIQSIWRGALARQNLHRSIGAAILIQAYSRGFIGRRLGRLKKMFASRRLESRHRLKSEKSAISQGTVDSSWQKGLANDLWQARKVRLSDDEEGRNTTFSRHTADVLKASSEENNRSLSSVDKKNQRNEITSATQDQFSSAEELNGKHHRPKTSRSVNLNRVAFIKTSAAIKIQTRYRTYVCERKLIRSLVDILIVQTVARRWLARRRAARLRTLRDRCRTILKEGKPDLNKYHQATNVPRLVSRSEFFQHRIVHGQVDHPHLTSTSGSRPSFDEDEFRQLEKDRRSTGRKPIKHMHQASSDEYRQHPTQSYHKIVNRSTPSSLQRTKGPGIGMSDSHAPHWVNKTLRPTENNATGRLDESRVHSIPSDDSETRPATQATHLPANSGRRQVVVTPTVLLKKNTDRQVLRR